MDEVVCECGFAVPITPHTTECICPQCESVLRVDHAASSLDSMDLPPTADSDRPSTSFLHYTEQPSSAVDAALQPTVVPKDSNPTAPQAESPAFGDYEIVREIARGGMGVVYLARQKSLKRTVALKVIRSGSLAGSSEIQRFRQEAEAAARLSHPGIVPVYDFGEHQGQPYFSMEFVEGPNLAAELQDGPMEPRRAAAILEKIANAMQYAHRQGVIHRDLKPGNVLLESGDEPKVTDFGLAKNTDSDSDMTGTGQILGTASFMPPEQASGDGKQVGPLADLYSLGAILYYLLTGRPPFQAAHVMDTLLQVLNIEPAPPRRLNPQIPLDLETICLRCLEKSPARRYESAEALAAELQRFRTGTPILARPTGKLTRFGKWCRRRPAVALLLFVAITSLLVGIGVSTLFAIQANDQANRADEARREAVEAQRESQIQSARLALQRGIDFCRQGRTRLGLIWLAESSALAPKDAHSLRRVVHRNIDAWFPELEFVQWTKGPSTIRVAKFTGLNEATGQLLIGPSSPGRMRSRIDQTRNGNLEITTRVPVMPQPNPDVRWFSDENQINESGTLLYTDLGDDRIDLRCVPINGGQLVIGPHSGRLANLTPDGLSIRAIGQYVDLLNLRSGKPSGEPLVFHSRVRKMAPDQQASRVAILTDNRALEVWRIANGTFAEVLFQNRVTSVGVDDEVELSPNGKYLAYVGQEMVARVWDVESGKRLDEFSVERADLEFHPTSQSLLFARDGLRRRDFHRQATSGAVEIDARDVPRYSRNGEFLFSPITGHVWKRIPSNRGVEEVDPLDVKSFARTSDRGRVLDSRDGSDQPRLYEISSGKAVGPTLLVEGNLVQNAFSPDGHWLVTGTDTGSVQLWSAESSTPVGSPVTVEPVKFVAFSPDQSAILVHCQSGDEAVDRFLRIPLPPSSEVGPARVRLWLNLITGLRINEIGVPENLDENELRGLHHELQALGGAPDKYRDSIPPMSIWDHVVIHRTQRFDMRPAPAPNAHPPLLLHVQNLGEAEFLEDGNRMVSLTDAGASVREVYPHRVQSSVPRPLKDSRYVRLKGTADNTFCLWTKERLGLRRKETMEFYDAACRPLRTIDLTTLPDQFKYDTWLASSRGLRFLDVDREWSSKSGHVDSHQQQGNCRFTIHNADNRVLRTFRRHWMYPKMICRSSDGQWLATASEVSPIFLEHLEDPQRSRAIPRDRRRNSILCFSPDSKVLCTTGAEALRIWNVDTGQLMGQLHPHEARVIRIAISHDHRFVALAQSDRTISIWNVESGQRRACYFELLEATNHDVRLAFSQDGSKLFTYRNGRIGLQVWDISAVTGPGRAESFRRAP